MTRDEQRAKLATAMADAMASPANDPGNLWRAYAALEAIGAAGAYVVWPESQSCLRKWPKFVIELRRSGGKMRTSIRWKFFRLWCDIGWMICPPEYREPLQVYMRRGTESGKDEWNRVESFLSEIQDNGK